MATQVNKKLIFYITVFFGAAIFILGGLWFLYARGDASRNIRRGDALMAAGQYEDAAKQYARGVSKEKSNLEYLDKWEASILAIVPPTQTEAKSRYGELVLIRRSRAIHQPDNLEFHWAVIEDAIKAAQWSQNSIESWQNVEDALLTMQDSINEDSLEEAQLLAEIGRAKQYLSPTEFTDTVDVEGNVRFPGEEELRAALTLDPENDLAWSSLAQGRLEVVARLELDGRSRQAEKQYEFAMQTFEDLERVVPDKPRSATALAKFYTIQYQRELANEAENTDELLAKKNAMIEQMEAVIQQTDDAMVVRNAVGLLRLSQVDNAYERSVKIISNYIDRDSDRVAFRHELAMLHYENSFQDEVALLKANELANGIVNGPGLNSSFNAVIQFPLQKRSASLLFDIALSQLERKKQENPDADLTDEELKCDEARLTLLNICGDDESDLLVLRADGKRAFVDGDYRLAAQKLEELWVRTERVDLSTARILIDALDRLGQTGLAYERTIEALKVTPSNVQLVIRKARLEAILGRYSQASETLSRVPESLIDEYEELSSLSDQLEEALATGSSSIGVVSKGLQDVFMKIGTNDLSGAKNDLAQLRESNPESTRVLLASIKVAVMLNDQALAQKCLQILKGLDPENAYIRAIEISLEIEDPIEAIISYLSEVNENPIERDIETAAAIISYMAIEEVRIQALISTGYAEVGREAQDYLVNAVSKLNTIIESLSEKAPDDLRVVKFSVLLDCDRGEWDLAEKKIERARQENPENTELLFMQAEFFQRLGQNLKSEGKLVAGKEKLLESVEVLKLLIKKLPYQAKLWRTLGLSYRDLGDDAQANQAFDEAYRRNPNDISLVKAYAKSLIKTPDGASRAIRIIRQAILLAPNQVELRELWLQLEAEQGNLPFVMKTRVDQYQANPADITNAANLVRLITLTDPTWEYIRNADDQLMYNSQSWERLSDNEQSARLASIRERWNDVAKEIIVELSVSLSENRAFASLCANLEMSQGNVEAGAQLLKDRISSLGEGIVGEDYIALASYFIEANRFSDAKQAFISAIELDDIYKRFAAQQLSNLYISQSQYVDALALLSEEMKDNPTSKVHARLIECLIWEGMLEEATEEIAIRNELYESDFYSQILQAKLHQAKSKQYGNGGDKELANIEHANAMRSLESSKKLLPTDSMPYMIEATGFIDKYQWDEDRLSLDRAIQSLDKADQLASSITTQTSLARVKVLNLLGNQNAADSTLRQLVLQFPNNVMARNMLVESLTSKGQVDDAILLIEEGIMLSPNSPFWYQRLGAVHQFNGSTKEAVTALLRAYNVSRDARLLLAIADITRDVPEWEGSLVVEVFRETPEIIGDSVLAGLFARAILSLNQRDKALEVMARAYQNIIVDGEDPDSIKRRYAVWFSDLESLFSESESSAGEAFVRSLPGYEENAQMLQGLALFWIRSYSGNQDRAIELLNMVVDSDYEDDQIISALHVLGQIYLVTDNFSEAGEVYSRILALNSSDGVALNNKAYVLMTTDSDLVEALALSERVVEMYPDNVTYQDTLARIYRSLGQTTKAIELLNKALAKDPQDLNALMIMSAIYSVDLEEPGQALSFAEQAKRLSPENAELLDELGWIHFQLGNDMEAEELLRKSVEIQERAVTYLHLAHVLALDGRFQGAISRLNRADELTKNPELKAEIASLRADIDEKAAISIP
ncbi:MAG: tetratricopeptide repeat protein [Phycisphaerales bacterium]|nr:tetratricopeptide repeat protein [Phycisphaerales bacterium]